MYKKVMVPLDGSKLAECVLPHVDAFITGCQVETIIFVRVIETTPTHFTSLSGNTSHETFDKIQENAKKIEAERKSSAAEYLREVAKKLKHSKVDLKTEVLVGRVADNLADYSETNGIDLILIATHGRSGISRWVRGSVADRVLRSACVPVLMVRADGTMSGEKA